MLVKAFPVILSEPNKDEVLTITHLHSLTSDYVVDLLLPDRFVHLITALATYRLLVVAKDLGQEKFH